MAEVAGILLFGIIVVWPLLTYAGDAARYIWRRYAKRP